MRFRRRERRAIGRLGQTEVGNQLLKAFAVLSPINAVRGGAENRYASAGQWQRQVEGGLATELDDDPIGLFNFDDVHDVFKGQRLEVETIGGIVIGTHRLGITVHHDGLVAVFFQGKGGMHAAIVELNALPNAVRPTTENDDFFHGLGLRFTHPLIGRIQVRRMRHKFGATGIDTLKRRRDLVLLAQGADAVGRLVHLAVALRT